MRQTTLKLELLDSIKEEKDGFRLGEIWRLSEKALGAIIPILRHKEFKRQYVMLEELSKDKYEVLDSGSINRIKIKGSFDKAVFVRTGNIFEGKGTQSRAAEISIIILPTKQKEEMIIPARCVHASHPISGNAKFERFGYAPREVTISLFAQRGQSEVWSNVGKSSMRLMRFAGGGSATQFKMDDSMVGNLKQLKEDKSKISKIMKKIPCLENQVGVIIFNENGVSNIELFDHPDSWKAFHENIIQDYSDILSKEQDEPLFEFKKTAVPGKIEEFIERLKNTKEKVVYENEKASTIILENEGVVGEYSLLNGEIIHLLASQKLPQESKRENPFLVRPVSGERDLVWGPRTTVPKYEYLMNV